MTNGQRRCPQCQRNLPGDAPSGLCRHCLFGALLAENLQDDPGLRTFGDYEILSVLARGGMGVVYRARQRSLNRIVALKLIRAGEFASEAERKRFRAEAEAAAQLDHPNIVPIYEVGEHDGENYFSMKLIEGGSLAEKCSGFRVSGFESETVAGHAERETRNAKLISTLARAVHYAHQRGVLHRDLKPGNILLNEQAQPFLTDFGLAKRVESSLDLTLSGAVLGSPNYMPPEQASGGSNGITTAADIYSLGAILYELLAGQPPFTADTALATMRAVMEEEPKRPSTIQQRVNRDLETICLKCLEKDPGRRYRSAEALAEDLERWSRHEPIQARPSRAWENAIKWTKRRPALAALLALGVATPLTIIALLAVMSSNVTRERNLALRQEERATNALARAEAETRRADQAAARTRENLYAADMLLAQHSLDGGNLGQARRLVQAWLPRNGAAGSDLRGFEWRWLWQRCQGDQLRTLRGHDKAVTCVAFSPDGQRLVSCGEDFKILLWSAETGQLLETRQELKDIADHVSFTPDGGHLVVGLADGTVKLLRLDPPGAPWTFAGRRHTLATSLRNSPQIVACTPEPSRRNTVQLYDWEAKRLVRIWPGAGDPEAISRDDRILATSFNRGFRVDLWNLNSGAHLRALTNVDAHILGLSPNGETVALMEVAHDREVQLWEAASDRPVSLLAGHTGRIYDLDFSPDGRWLATASADQSVRLWDVRARKEAACLRGHESMVRRLAFSPDGRTIATAGADHTVRLWPAETKTPEAAISNVHSPFLLSPDGRTFVASPHADFRSNDVPMQVCDLVSGKTELLPKNGLAQPVFFDAEGRTLAVLERDPAGQQVLRFWDITSRTAVTNVALAQGLVQETAVGFSAHQNWIALGHNLGRITIWSALSGEMLHEVPRPAGRIRHEVARMAFAPDGKTLAASYSTWLTNRLFVLWDIATWTERARLDVGMAKVFSIHFSNKSQWLALGLDDHTIRLWNGRTGEPLATLAGHQAAVDCVRFSPDDRELVSAAGDEVKLWQLASRRELATLLKATARPRFCEFTPDGNALVVVDWATTLRVVRVPPLAEINAQPKDGH